MYMHIRVHELLITIASKPIMEMLITASRTLKPARAIMVMDGIATLRRVAIVTGGHIQVFLI